MHRNIIQAGFKIGDGNCYIFLIQNPIVSVLIHITDGLIICCIGRFVDLIHDGAVFDLLVFVSTDTVKADLVGCITNRIGHIQRQQTGKRLIQLILRNGKGNAARIRNRLDRIRLIGCIRPVKIERSLFAANNGGDPARRIIIIDRQLCLYIKEVSEGQEAQHTSGGVVVQLLQCSAGNNRSR